MANSILRCTSLSLLLALSALSLAGVSVAHANSKVGVASAVKNQVQGSGSRTLAVGSEVFANERIKTGDASTAQLMFLDKTVLSMGPKAELMLDKYVYNPNRGTGQVVVNAVQGGMRFVTGAQNPTSYAIKTPVATIGIRGTVVDLQVSAIQTFIGVLEGTLTIRMLDGSTMTVGKGQYVIIAANGSKKASGPYKGDDPTNTDFPDYIRIDEINQLEAIRDRQFKAPVEECYSYYCGEYPSSSQGRRR